MLDIFKELCLFFVRILGYPKLEIKHISNCRTSKMRKIVSEKKSRVHWKDAIKNIGEIIARWINENTQYDNPIMNNITNNDTSNINKKKIY